MTESIYTFKELGADELSLLGELFNYRDINEMIAGNRGRILRGEISVFALFAGERLVGELRVAYEHEDAAFAVRGRRAYLYAFRVHRDLRGRGLGTRLLKEVLARLEKAGYTEFTVGVEDDNPRARELYRRFGFLSCVARRYEEYQGDGYEYDLLLKTVNEGEHL